MGVMLSLSKMTKYQGPGGDIRGMLQMECDKDGNTVHGMSDMGRLLMYLPHGLSVYAVTRCNLY